MPTKIAATTEGQGAAQSRGVLLVHACPRALSPHVEWAVAQVLGRRVTLQWTVQPVLPTNVRAEFSWVGAPGTAAALASALRGYGPLRYEVTQDAGRSGLGERYAVTPALGVFRAAVGVHGDIMLTEDRVRSAMAAAASSGRPLAAELEAALGSAWDEELEPFRYAGDGAPVRYLHQVG